jgi:hypothetical protein
MPKLTDISILVISGAMNLAGSFVCAEPALAGMPAASPAQQRTTLDRIAERCHLSKSIFHISQDRMLHFQPPSNERYHRVDCALRALRETGLERTLPMGFVGNEARH